MSKAKDYPGSQPFNVGARKNLTKSNSWWSKPPYHNNPVQKKERKEKSA
jgi:hypothetical protein